MNRLKRFFNITFLLTILLFNSLSVWAAEDPVIEGKCAILMERSTGKILYEKNATAKAYPASTTKILVAIIMLEYIDMDEIIVMGEEVSKIPKGSSKAEHKVGESISGRNLLRGLMLPSGNESGCVVAMNVARRVTGQDSISYEQAEIIFSEMMNEKAKELGAENSHFVNPHGFHDDLHFSTAKDMALICKAALEIPEFAEVAAETAYKGDSVTENVTPDMMINTYNWRTTNELLIESSEFYYEYARGIKTGYTGPAGYCLASTAKKDGMELIAVVFHSEDDKRYRDSLSLYEYGFDNYEFSQVQKDGVILDNVAFGNPRLGEATNMDVQVRGEYTDLFIKEQIGRIASEIVYNPAVIYTPEGDENGKDGGEPGENAGKVHIKLPVSKGDVLGHISYTIDGKEIYSGELVATASAEERTKESDYEYYKEKFMDFIFTADAIPYWIGLGVIVLLLLILIVRIIRRLFRKKERYRIHYRQRRY